MKKICLTLILVMLSLGAVPAFAEWELGVSVSPFPRLEVSAAESDKKFDIIWGVHAAFTMWDIFYVSLDSLALPAPMVEAMTSKVSVDNAGYMTYVPGYYRPGFMNLLDVGAKLSLKPVYFIGELGINFLYLYHQKDLPKSDQSMDFGVNLRLGAGIYLSKSWTVVLTGTVPFSSFGQMGDFFRALGSNDQAISDKAAADFGKSMIFSLGVNLNFN